jgi:hypothetical protein
VGAESFERYQGLRKSSIETVDALSPERHYLVRAQAAVDGQPTGSSAGGEQPKFSAAVLQTDGIVKRVLVKFSPSGDSFSAQRWRDLLICESLALEVLRDSGFATAESRILEGGGRTFLETIRFDRIGNHGRKGTVSLAAFENEWIGHGVNWSVSADSLERGKWISSEDLKTIQRIECFGRLIANSDRHPGNLSFFWQPGDDRATLAPVYDMLPMLYAPSSGGEDTRKVFTLPFYDHTLLSVWKDAVSIATVYWERVVEDSRLSREFRKIAEHNRLALR